jgi:adenosylcobyric acid synthase
VGICGGYQMLGRAIHDLERVESSAGSVPGLGLLPFETSFEGDKTTSQVSATLLETHAWLAALENQALHGYEIHMGQSSGNRPWLRLRRRAETTADEALDGDISADGRVWGCYLHGIFENTNLRRAWLGSLGWRPESPAPTGPEDRFTRDLAKLADAVEASLDMRLLEQIVWEN